MIFPFRKNIFNCVRYSRINIVQIDLPLSTLSVNASQSVEMHHSFLGFRIFLCVIVSYFAVFLMQTSKVKISLKTTNILRISITLIHFIKQSLK